MTQDLLFPTTERRNIPWTEVPDYRPPINFPRIHEAKTIVLDLETKGLDPLRGGKIAGIALKTGDGLVRDYWPVAHQGTQNCDQEKTFQWLRDELSQFKGEILGANSNLFDGFFLHMNNIRPKNVRWRDVQWAEALIDEEADKYALNALAKKYLNLQKGQLEDVYGENVKEFMDEVHPAHCREYALTDLDLAEQVYAHQQKILASEKLTKLFDLECRLNPMLLHMREKGVRVDVEKAAQVEIELLKKYREGVEKLSSMVGFDVDPFSPTIATAFDKLGITYPRTELGNPSIRTPWLKFQTHPFAQLLAETKELEKLRGTFIRGYVLDGNINGRIHAQFHPLRRADEDGERGTASGRFSSTDPNLQNIPIRTALGKEIRKMFVADEGMRFHSSDVSQYEFRLLTHFAVLCKCRDAAIAQERYLNDPDTDFHQMTASLTGLERSPAKVIGYGLCYGMGIRKLAASLGLVDGNGDPTPAALDIIETFHERAPFVREMYNLASDRAQKQGFVKTILGRRCRFNLFEPKYAKRGEIFPPLPLAEAKRAYGSKLKRSGTHKALNRILQGSNADGIKKAMVDIWEAGLVGPDLDISLTIHDELAGSVAPTPEGEKTLANVRQLMRESLPLKVPVLVDGGVGKDWDSAK